MDYQHKNGHKDRHATYSNPQWRGIKENNYNFKFYTKPNENKQTDRCQNLTRGGNYRSPEVTVAEIFNEGVLCLSGSHEDWEIDNDLWS